MPSRIDRLKTWYADPLRAPLRGEVAWSWAWLMRERGWMWVLLYAALNIIDDVVSSQIRDSLIDRQDPFLSLELAWTFLAGVPAMLVAFVWWVKILRLRTFSKIQSYIERNKGIRGSLSFAQWIALIAAPALVGFYFSLGRIAKGVSWVSIVAILERFGVADSDDGGMTSFLFTWIALPLGLFRSGAWEVACASFVVAFAFPGGRVRWIVGGTALITLLSLPVLMAPTAITLSLAGYVFEGSSLVSYSWLSNLIRMGLSFIFSIGFSALVGWVGYRWLVRRWLKSGSSAGESVSGTA